MDIHDPKHDTPESNHDCSVSRLRLGKSEREAKKLAALSSQSGICDDDGVITYVRGTPAFEKEVPAEVSAGMHKNHPMLYKCSQCAFYLQRKQHVRKHYMRIHVLDGNPHPRKRKFAVQEEHPPTKKQACEEEAEDKFPSCSFSDFLLDAPSTWMPKHEQLQEEDFMDFMDSLSSTI